MIRSVIAWSVLCVSACVAAPPNFVVFVVDDLGYADLGCFGSTFYDTPRLDRLAREGMRLTQGYAACPVCSPTRAALMTGKYPQRVGITNWIDHNGSNQPQNWKRNTKLLPAAYSDRLAHDELTLPEALHRQHYQTYFAGKWHLGPQGYWPQDQGFDVNIGGYEAGHPKSYFAPYQNPQLADGPPGEHLPDRLARETCAWIDQHASAPFLVYLSFYSVHTPLQAPPQLVAKYEARAQQRPEARFGREHASQVRLDQTHAVYGAMVESMDTAVGKVLDQLEASGLTENTVIVFTSDNGGLSTSEGSPTSNEPLRAGKGWAYEGGIRVPYIVRWPGVTKPGSTASAPVISMDIYTTLRTAAGASIGSDEVNDGIDLKPLLGGGESSSRTLFWDYPHYGNQGGGPVAAVRDGRWKLVSYYEPDNPLELYNLDDDPSEQRNVAPSHPDEVQRLRRELAQWRKQVGAVDPQPRS